MTTKQFRRMQVFALRMVPTAIRGNRWKKELREHVSEVLSRLACQNFGIHYSTITDWDHPEPIPGDDGTCGFAWSHPRSLLCDFISEYCWDRGLKYKEEGKDSKIAVALACCIRAACDVAVAPSGGVLGWTVGDLRTMWKPKPIPAWVHAYFTKPLTRARSSTPVWL